MHKEVFIDNLSAKELYFYGIEKIYTPPREYARTLITRNSVYLTSNQLNDPLIKLNRFFRKVNGLNLPIGRKLLSYLKTQEEYDEEKYDDYEYFSNYYYDENNKNYYFPKCKRCPNEVEEKTHTLCWMCYQRINNR